MFVIKRTRSSAFGGTTVSQGECTVQEANVSMETSATEPETDDSFLESPKPIHSSKPVRIKRKKRFSFISSVSSG